VLGEGTADVLWPLPGNRWRWSFQLSDQAQVRALREKSRVAVQMGSQAFQQLGEEFFESTVARRAPWFTARPGDMRWSVVVRFEHRLATSFGRGRAWLAGDAGHLTGPVGVHSMNVGLREGHDLAARMAGAEAGDLTGYDAERQAEWRALLGLTPTPLASGDAWIAGQAARLLATLPASGAERDFLASRLAGPA